MRLLSILCVSFLLCSCISSADKKREQAMQMLSKKVFIPFDYMSCWINDSIQNMRSWEKNPIKLIVYTDSVDCCECTLKRMYLWSDFVELEKKYKNKFHIAFIFHPRKGTKINRLVSMFYLTELNHPIYVDSVGYFASMNPNIDLSNPMCKVFLLDSNNTVTLIGNPLFNRKIEYQLQDILEKYFNN